jgi:hypothetical protein
VRAGTPAAITPIAYRATKGVAGTRQAADELARMSGELNTLVGSFR